MTLEEFNQAIAKGQVNFQQPVKQEIQGAPNNPGFDGDVPVIEAIKRPRIYLATVPTFVPKSFADSIQYVDDGTTKKPYFYINGEWVTSGSGASPIYWYVDVVIGASSTNYIGFYRTGGTESAVQTIIPASGTISNLYINTSTAQPASGSAVYTFRNNATDQSIVVTVAANAAAGNFSDLTHSFSVVAGDLIDIKVVNNATANAGKPFSAIFKFTPS